MGAVPAWGESPDRSVPLRVSPAVAAMVVLVATIAANYAHTVLVLSPSYNRLHATSPWYAVELLDKVLVLGIVALGLWILYRRGTRTMARALTLDTPIAPAVAFALIAVLPMLVGFAATRRFSPDENVPALVFTGILAPFVEEVHVRAFGFWQLRERLRWPFWLAVLPQAVLSGLGHIEKGSDVREVLGIFVLLFSGGVIFSWLLERWRSIWFPFVLHVAMNTVWDLFSVSNTVLGGWFPFFVQQLTMVTAIAITIYFRGWRGVSVLHEAPVD